MSKLHPTTPCSICIRLCHKQGAGIPNDSCFHPPRGLSQLWVALICCSDVPNSQLVRAQGGHTHPGLTSPIPSCRKALGWDSCLAELTCTLSSPRPAVPHWPGFLSVRGVRAAQTLWKALLPPKAHKGTSQLTDTALKHTWNTAVILDNPNPGLCHPHILPEGTQVQLYQQCLHQRLFYPFMWAVCRYLQSGSWFKPRAGIFL